MNFTRTASIIGRGTDRRKNFSVVFTFSQLNYIYYKDYTTYSRYTSNADYTDNNNNNTNKTICTMHRTYRNDMQQAQKDKIAAANIGKTLSPQTKEKISQSMQKYWSELPYKPDTDDSATGTTPTNPYKD